MFSTFALFRNFYFMRHLWLVVKDEKNFNRFAAEGSVDPFLAQFVAFLMHYLCFGFFAVFRK